VTPLSLGIETLGGITTPMIERNTTIPTRKSEVFSTAADSQPAVEVHVLQGEREFAKDNITLGQFHLVGIPPAPRGVPQIEVTFDIDANGIVNVSAKDLGTGTEQSIKIESQTSLTEDEINQKIEEAEKFAEDDKLRKARVELRNQADSIIYQTRKTIEETGDKLSEEDTTPVSEKLNELEALIMNGDEAIPLEDIDQAAIQAKLSEVEQLMHGLSTKIYEAAAAEMAEEQTSEEGTNVGEDGVVEADFEVVDSDDEDES
ncbi:MAG: Hsp70 family protein, partial [Candidatus Poseidoniales archaeon]